MSGVRGAALAAIILFLVVPFSFSLSSNHVVCDGGATCRHVESRWWRTETLLREWPRELTGEPKVVTSKTKNGGVHYAVSVPLTGAASLNPEISLRARSQDDAEKMVAALRDVPKGGRFASVGESAALELTVCAAFALLAIGLLVRALRR